MAKKLLLHVCCAPCSTVALEKLHLSYKITGFFCNPNIHPLEEYKARKEEVIRYFKEQDFELIIASKYETRLWFEIMQETETRHGISLKDEAEGGIRCQECYKLRLLKTAELAKNLGFDAFTTTLTVSPHKKAKAINLIGKEIEKDLEIEFIEEDFKKNNGFKRSVELSKESGLRRQDYCGCVFSKMSRQKQKKLSVEPSYYQ